jgi:hypothetical protein
MKSNSKESICVNLTILSNIDEDVKIGLYASYECVFNGIEGSYCTHSGWYKVKQYCSDNVDNLCIEFIQCEDNLKFKKMDVYVKFNGDVHCYSFTPKNFTDNTDTQKWTVNITEGKNRPKVIIQREFTNKEIHTDYPHRHVCYDAREYCSWFPCILTNKQMSVTRVRRRLYIEYEQRY